MPIKTDGFLSVFRSKLKSHKIQQEPLMRSTTDTSFISHSKQHQ